MDQQTYFAINPSVVANALTLNQTVDLTRCFFQETSDSPHIPLHSATLLPPPASATSLGLQLTGLPSSHTDCPQIVTTLYQSADSTLHVPPCHPLLVLLPHLPLQNQTSIPLYFSHTLSLSHTHGFLQTHIATNWLPASLISLWTIPFQVTALQRWPNSRYPEPSMDLAIRYPKTLSQMVGETSVLHLHTLADIFNNPSSIFTHVRDHLLLRYILPLLDPNWTILISDYLSDDEPPTHEEFIPTSAPDFGVPPYVNACNEYTLRYLADPLDKTAPQSPQSHTQRLIDFFPNALPSTFELKHTLQTIETRILSDRLTC